MASLDSRLWYTEPGSVCRGAVARTRDRDTLNPDPHTAGANFPQSTAARASEMAAALKASEAAAAQEVSALDKAQEEEQDVPLDQNIEEELPPEPRRQEGIPRAEADAKPKAKPMPRPLR